MNKIGCVLTELEGSYDWKTNKSAGNAAFVFARHYQGTSVRHRLADALLFADATWDAKGIDSSHAAFVLKAVVVSSVDDWAVSRFSVSATPTDSLAVGFSRLLADIFLAYHAYWLRYTRTMRGGWREKEWKLMKERFQKLSPVDRTTMFEEFISVMLAENEYNDWILRELAPLLAADGPTAQLVRHACERTDREKPVGRQTWEAILAASLDHVVAEATKAIGPVPAAA